MLTIARDDLADLLRGRSDLSLSVLKGFYLTFVRRLQQACWPLWLAKSSILSSPCLIGLRLLSVSFHRVLSSCAHSQLKMP